MKKWRLDAAKVNAEATQKENDRRRDDARLAAAASGFEPVEAFYTPVKLTNRGRAAKPILTKDKPPVSDLFWKLLDKGNIKFMRSDREIQAEQDKMEAQAVEEQDAEEVPQ